MNAADPFARAPGRPVWLITLADLALLLVGFFVLMQAHRADERPAVSRAIAEAFGAAVPDPLPVAATRITFAPASATPQGGEAALVAWARAALTDPRVTLRIAGATAGDASDRDPASGSAMLLATDRARAVAARLAAAGVPEGRLTITTDAGAHARAVTVTLAFTGEKGSIR